MEQEKGVIQCYSNSNGKYQEQYDKLYKELVPIEGQAETLNGELIRAISRLFYEYYNNGNCNAQKCIDKHESCSHCNGDGEDEDGEECTECGGSGEEDDDYDIEISDYYQDYLGVIRKHIPAAKVGLNEIEKIIVTEFGNNNREQFSEKRMSSYNGVINVVMEYVLTNKNKPFSQKD